MRLSSLRYQEEMDGLWNLVMVRSARCLETRTIGKHLNLTIENVDYVEGLTHNLISIDQLCSIGYKVLFIDNEVHLRLKNNILYKGTSLHNIYTFDLDTSNNLKCLVISNDSCWLWHRRLSHAVHGPNLKVNAFKLWFEVFQRSSLKRINFVMCANETSNIELVSPLKMVVSTSRQLKLLHLDLFGPTQVASLEWNAIFLCYRGCFFLLFMGLFSYAQK